MNKILFPFILILTVIILDRLLGGIGFYIVDKSKFRFSQVYNQESKPEIVFLGNSRGAIFSQFDPKKINGTFLNLSYNGLPMDIGYLLFLDLIEQNPHIKLLIIEVSMCDRGSNLFRHEITPYCHLSKRISGFLNEDRKPFSLLNLSYLAQLNSELFLRCIYYYNNPDFGSIASDTVQNRQIIEKEKVYNTKIKLLPKMTDYLQKLVRICKDRGIETKLILNPLLENYALLNSELYDQLDTLQENEKLTIYDYSKTLDKQHFVDLRHLNKNGAEVFQNILIADGFFD